MIVYYDMIQLRRSIQMYNSYRTIQKELFLFEHNFERMILKCCKNKNGSFLREVV